MSNIDEQFKAIAADIEQEERDKAERKATGGGSGSGFKPVKWTGLEKGKMKVIRIIGKYPDFNTRTPQLNRTPSDARVVRMARIIDDNRKRMKLVLPLNNTNHLFWRIINRVNEFEWKNDPEDTKKKMRVFSNEKLHPDIFNIINYNNLPESDKRRQFGWEGHGWLGKEVFIMNVIDRGMKKWHEENKHTVLLAKNLNIVKASDGSGKVLEFPEEGIPSFGFTTLLAMNCLKHYGDWENYDVAIIRTGLTSPAYNVINASKHIEEVDSALQSLVITGSLTAEEAAYEAYDLDLIYGTTSYIRFYNGLKLTVAQIDKALGTNFFDELKKSCDKEAEERKAKKAAEPSDFPPSEETPAPAPEPTPEEKPATPTRRPAPTPEASAADNRTSLPGWSKLSDSEKAMVVSATLPLDGNGKKWAVKYTVDKRLAECQECGTISPESFTVCPGCGVAYVF